MPTEQRFTAEFQQTFRPITVGPEPTSDAGREYDGAQISRAVG
jgi:hypothetical protein